MGFIGPRRIDGSKKQKIEKTSKNPYKTNGLAPFKKTKKQSDFRFAEKRAKPLRKSLFLHFRG